MLENAIGIKTTVVLPAGIDLRLGSGASIAIDEIRGPNYDGDRNGLPDANDDDEDGIIEGSPAIGTFNRIGLWIAATGGASSIAGSIIGEAGSSIRVDGNNARGVQIDQALGGDFDFSTTISNGSMAAFWATIPSALILTPILAVITASAALLMCAEEQRRY